MAHLGYAGRQVLHSAHVAGHQAVHDDHRSVPPFGRRRSRAAAVVRPFARSRRRRRRRRGHRRAGLRSKTVHCPGGAGCGERNARAVAKKRQETTADDSSELSSFDTHGR